MEEIIEKIDYTLIKGLEFPSRKIREFCGKVVQYKIKNICVHPNYLDDIVYFLDGYLPNISIVVGFPDGNNSLFDTKIQDVLYYIQKYRGLIAGFDVVTTDINEMKQIIKIAHTNSKKIKAIVNTPVKTKEEIKYITLKFVEFGADWIKTATGFNGKTKIEDVLYIKQLIGGKCKIKAAGGIRTIDEIKSFLKNGADIIGMGTLPF